MFMNFSMHDETTTRQCLECLAAVLRQNHELNHARVVENALSGSLDDLKGFLASNDLWGGSGSLADQAGSEQSRIVKRLIEAALIKLGEQQILEGVKNVRTQMWINTFRQWQIDGI
jgi:hypothetical protein